MKKRDANELAEITWVVAAVWQKEDGREITQILLMFGVRATTRDNALLASVELEEAELAKQKRVGYTRTMRNAAAVGFEI